MFIYLMMLDTEEEKSKFEKIYFKYRQLMFQVANGILKDECLSEDAVHESFIKIMKLLKILQYLLVYPHLINLELYNL